MISDPHPGAPDALDRRSELEPAPPPAAPGRWTAKAHQIPGPWPVSSQARGILITHEWLGAGGRRGCWPQEFSWGPGSVRKPSDNIAFILSARGFLIQSHLTCR